MHNLFLQSQEDDETSLGRKARNIFIVPAPWNENEDEAQRGVGDTKASPQVGFSFLVLHFCIQLSGKFHVHFLSVLLFYFIYSTKIFFSIPKVQAI